MSESPNAVNDQTDDRPTFVARRLAASYLGVSERHVYRLIAEGALPAYRVGRRSVRIKVSDLEALPTRLPVAG